MKQFVILFLLAPLTVAAQIGGRNVFDFLNLSQSGRIAALGGLNISTRDNDANFAWQNPALLSDSMDKYVNFSVCNYVSDISFGNVSYTQHNQKIGTFFGGLQYANYGKFTQADEFGNITGNYRASELALVAGLARGWNRFDYGITTKFLYSNLATYNALGLGFDIGASYHSENELFSAGIVAKNMGFVLSQTGTPAQPATLPFDLQAGLSYKLQYMPMRLSVTAHHLQTPILIYNDPNKAPDLDFNGNPVPPKKRIGDKIVSHFVVGTEFYLGKSLRLRAGYNHLRRIELRSATQAGLAGFTMGLGLRVSKFRLDYGFVRYGAGMNSHQFSIATHLASFKKKE